MKKGIVILICLALGFLAIATQVSVSAAVVVENSDTPVWEIGDQWCMGYEDTLDESDMDDEFGNEFFEPSKLIFDGKMGYYRALTVEDDDTVITVGETEYTCYDVYYEEYIAMSARMEIAMNIDFEDIMEQLGSEFDTSEVDMSEFEDMSMSMMMSGYMWYDLEITGHIYFTVEDLAIAKGSFDFLLNSDLDMVYDVSYSGAIFEGMFEDEYEYETRGDAPEQGGYQGSDETRIYYKLKQTIKDWSASYDILYNPPIDIFDFPINKYDSWSTYSDMTIILNQLSGSITYDIMMDYGYGTPETDKGTNVIGEGMSFPQTYGPEEVDYSFYCSDTEYKKDTDGTETECYQIEPGYYGYWDDYYDDEILSNYWDASSYMSMDMDDPSVIGTEEIEGYDQANPIDTMARSESWYSFDSMNVVAATPPEADESGMFGDGEDELEAQTYSEVTTFKEVTRDDIKSDYEDYKASSKDSSDSDDESDWLFWVFLIAIIVVVILVAVIGIWTRNRKRQRGYYQQQPGQPQGQPPAQYQPPGDRGIRVAEEAPPNQGPQAPKIVRQPKIVNNQAPPQPQPQQQPYYPPPQQQQQPYYPPPQQQNQYPPPPPQSY